MKNLGHHEARAARGLLGSLLASDGDGDGGLGPAAAVKVASQSPAVTNHQGW
jgi:hypothetical protein